MRPSSVWRRHSGLVALALAVFLVGGCGDDDGDTSEEATALCVAVDPVQDLGRVFEIPDDPDEVRRTMTEAGEALDSLQGQRPEAVADDLATVESIFTAADEALAAVDYDIYAVPDEQVEVLNDLDGVELQQAADNIEAWAGENCTADGG